MREEAATGDARRVLHTFNRYQAAEYNTTVNRCRTAKQWGEFADPDHMRLFPNLRWLPSRSATPREEHMKFYNRVWAKNDPFWQQNQPGNLWNCKCDWEETDDPCTDGNPTTPVRSNGLDGNPALTGQVFTDKHAYISKAGNNRKEKDRVEIECKKIANKDYSKNTLIKYRGKEFECQIGDETRKIQCKQTDLKHLIGALYRDEMLWIKNELIIRDIQELCKNTEFVGQKICDTTHNTGDTLKLKKATDYFFYYKKILNGKVVYLHVGRYRDTKNMYLYDITTYNPIKK